MSSLPGALKSVCVFCASSADAQTNLLAAAAAFGVILAEDGLRLVYGGGSLGLMGACARAAKGAGGEVLGVIPKFLTALEPPLRGIETVVVTSMHQRKMRMFEEADAFAILPGAIGTLEEAVELISWRRLGLHDKPIVFWDPDGYWRPLFDMFARFLAEGLAPPRFARCWTTVEAIQDILPAIRRAGGSETAAAEIARLT
ncbi:MAG: LOG family protein [Caulobacteraceae bacterium]